MSAPEKIAHMQGRRDEAPNQELARELAERKDKKGIREIAEHLWDKDKNIQADCIKVLYEIGYLKPELIADFVKLLGSKNNRLVWGGMTALSTIAGIKADVIFRQRAVVQHALTHGSVITVDHAVRTLAVVASTSPARNNAIFPDLLHHIATCRSKDVPQHAEKMLVAVNGKNKAEFIGVLERRLPNLSHTQAGRVKKVILRTKGNDSWPGNKRLKPRCAPSAHL
jgi:hypothetical protein